MHTAKLLVITMMSALSICGADKSQLASAAPNKAPNKKATISLGYTTNSVVVDFKKNRLEKQTHKRTMWLNAPPPFVLIQLKLSGFLPDERTAETQVFMNLMQESVRISINSGKPIPIRIKNSADYNFAYFYVHYVDEYGIFTKEEPVNITIEITPFCTHSQEKNKTKFHISIEEISLNPLNGRDSLYPQDEKNEIPVQGLPINDFLVMSCPDYYHPFYSPEALRHMKKKN